MLRIIASSLKWKFITLMTAVIVLMVSVIGVFSYLDTSQTLKNDIEHFSEQILKQANRNLSRYYQAYEQGFLLLGSSTEAKEWMALEPEDTRGKAFTYYDIKDNYILPLMSKHAEILSVSLLSDKGNEVHVENGYFRLVKDYTLTNKSWLNKVREQDELYIEVSESHNYLSTNSKLSPMLVMTMVKQVGLKDNGLIKMDIALEPVQNILQEIKLSNSGISMVADLSNQIIVHPDDTQITKKLPEDISSQFNNRQSGWFFREKSRDMVIFETIMSTNWKTIAVIPYDEMNKSIVRVRNVTIVTTLLALTFSVLLVFSLTTSITNRLSRLRQIIRKTKTGNIELRAPEHGVDEIAELGIAYNQMLDRLDGTIHELADSRMQQKQAAMKAMQSQINSHFLYNTLETINSMANLVNHREIEMAAINLSKMLRYASNYERTLVSLSEELDHTLRYLSICKLRFNDQVTFDIHVDENCSQLLCLKAILQPVVENSMRHGIEKSGCPMHIIISAQTEEEHLLITVEDNGLGFSQAALLQLQTKMENQKGNSSYQELSNVGLLNVHYRIRMFDQHPNSGLNMYNNEHGAVSEIRMLIRTNEEVRRE